MSGTAGLGTIGVTTISSQGSQLTSFDGFSSAKGSAAMGTVSFATGALLSGSVSGGGVFSTTGSSFTVIGIGKWEHGLPGSPKGKMTLFSGSFVGPIDWTLDSVVGPKRTYTLTGDLAGVLWNGTTVTGATVQNFFTENNGQMNQGIGHMSVGSTQLATVPEPGTLGLLGAGLVAIAGAVRRKLMI
jgi:hypothetical protein